MSATSNLRFGAKYPYDADDDDIAPAAIDWAHKAARGVLANLLDRQGIKHELRGVDAETRAEIVETVAEIIRLAAKQENVVSTPL